MVNLRAVSTWVSTVRERVTSQASRHALVHCEQRPVA